MATTSDSSKAAEEGQIGATAKVTGNCTGGNGGTSSCVVAVTTDIKSSTIGGAAQMPESLVLNVGGQRFESLKKNFLTHFPNSRLWRLLHAVEAGADLVEILRYCDRYKRGHGSSNDDDFVPDEVFFDKSWAGFGAILDAYRSGCLHMNSAICAIMTRDDLVYWGMDELALQPCCAVKFYPEIEICVKEVDMEEHEKVSEIERERIEDFGQTFLGRSRKYLWNLFEYPSTSRAAQFNACFSLSMVVVSTACFVLSCIYDEASVFIDLAEEEKSSSALGDVFGYIGGGGEKQASTYIEEKSGITTMFSVKKAQQLVNDSSTTTASTPAMTDEQQTSMAVINAIVWIDAFTAVYFTIEYVVRVVTCPQKFKFIINPMNLVDLFAILPYFVSFVVDHLSEFHIIGKTGKVLRLVRVTRILRVFKLVRHFAGLQSLFCTLRQASKELGLLIMLVSVSVLTFSSLVYFSEKEEQNWTFVEAFWWGLLTITTVGYGTVTPVSATGKLIGGFCALFGVFTITLPVPILVNSFTNFYKNRLWRGEVATRRRERHLANPTAAAGNNDSAHIGNSTKDPLFELNGVQ